VLTSIDWRLVFLINVVLAAITIAMTLKSTPDYEREAGATRIGWAGTVTFGLGIAALVFGLSQGQEAGWSDPVTLIPLAGSAVLLAVFVAIEMRVQNPLLEFQLFRRLNFLASNVSQMLAGAIELGIGFLMPYYLLLVVGYDPAVAGLALIPGTIPIILAGPLAGRAFDRVGGRIPLAAGFIVLAASGAALALAAGEQAILPLMPGLLLQGIGLGVVLTVNDPTGLSAVPAESRGQAAGTINTTEQLGGAIGIAGLTAVELGSVEAGTESRLEANGIDPTPVQIERFREFILEAEQSGLRDAPGRNRPLVERALNDSADAHVAAFEDVFLISAGIALLGALACLVLVRKTDRTPGPVFGRRSRWVYADVGTSPVLTRHAPPGEGRGR
jgi:MFS family permease